uniref:Uncharacterized protein n=1 Tax=Anguilla anguilla TaxID=7936 RepID=A0A0E9PKF7_ANGAN
MQRILQPIAKFDYFISDC